MPGTVGGRPGLRRLLMSYLFAASLRCQARSVAGVTGKTPVQRLRGRSRASAASHARSAGANRIGRLAAQHGILVPEREQLSILRPVAAAQQDSQAENAARQQ